MWQLWREGIHFYTHAITCPTCRKVMKYQNLRERKKKMNYATKSRPMLRAQAQERANRKYRRLQIIKETLQIIAGAAGLIIFIVIWLYVFGK